MHGWRFLFFSFLDKLRVRRGKKRELIFSLAMMEGIESRNKIDVMSAQWGQYKIWRSV